MVGVFCDARRKKLSFKVHLCGHIDALAGYGTGFQYGVLVMALMTAQSIDFQYDPTANREFSVSAPAFDRSLDVAVLLSGVPLGMRHSKFTGEVQGLRPRRIVVDFGLGCPLHSNTWGKSLPRGQVNRKAEHRFGRNQKTGDRIKGDPITTDPITTDPITTDHWHFETEKGVQPNLVQWSLHRCCPSRQRGALRCCINRREQKNDRTRDLEHRTCEPDFKTTFSIAGQTGLGSRTSGFSAVGEAGMSAVRSSPLRRRIFRMTCLVACLSFLGSFNVYAESQTEKSNGLFQQYCLDCHQGADSEGNLDLTTLLKTKHFDATLIFENIATGRMPPSDADSPSDAERTAMLGWLAGHQPESGLNTFRRISRDEFVQSVNDLLGTNLRLSKQIPEDRGTYNFNSDRRIQFSREVLGSYFAVADAMLDCALPPSGFPNEQTWVTNKLKDSHETYNVYVRDHQEGTLFSWTRANNGNSYSFFYDNFDPPVSGWYDLTFEAAKVGDFSEHVSIQVHAGKYYYADDRPQPQRLLDVISLGNRELKLLTTRVFLNPGENISVHCYSKHNWRQKSPSEGAYIRQLQVRGPIQDQWPPSRYSMLFSDLPTATDPPNTSVTTAGGEPASSALRLPESTFKSNLQRIGGKITVSSFQQGMEKEKMQDGSNKTFWHTRFKPTLAKPPHYVILENPRGAPIHGLTYATWSGGNGNGQVKQYAIYHSDDGQTWGKAILSGELEIRLANEQPIRFAEPTSKRFLKFEITDARTLDGRSLASIGKLDVGVSITREVSRTKVVVDSDSIASLEDVLKRFAERAFSSKLTESELAPYSELVEQDFQEHGDFVNATKVGMKAVICSPRFLLVPGEHSSPAHAQAAFLARTLWLSIPDTELRNVANESKSLELADATLRSQIHRMLADRQSDRMIESFCDQWLNLRSWNKVTPSLKLYPNYDDLLHHYLPLETQEYLAHLLRENMPVEHLIDSNYTFLNQRLAQHYGIDGVTGQHLRKVSLGSDVPRGGLLTMGSVLKITTDGFDTSPILRGAWVSKNIIGTPISPPPESVKAIEPEHGDLSMTLREQIEQHKNQPACYACHKSIDPYGFALENFDATGQWREKYRIERPHRGTFQFRIEGYFSQGGHVDASGEISGHQFRDAFELKKLLRLGHRQVGYNFAKKFFEYANGCEPTLKQRLALLTMLSKEPDKCRMKDVVTDVLVYSLLEQSHE